MSLFELRAITAAVESSGQKKAEAQVSRVIFSSIVSSQYICEYAERLWFRRGYTFEKRMPDNLIKVFASIRELLMSPADKLISLCTTYLRQPMLAFKLSFNVSLKAMFFTFSSLFTGCYFNLFL